MDELIMQYSPLQALQRMLLAMSIWAALTSGALADEDVVEVPYWFERAVQEEKPDLAGYTGCMIRAANRYNIPHEVFLAILFTEGGAADSIRENTNKTVDIGPMQINSHWIETLQKAGYGRLDYQSLMEPCNNFLFAAWVLAYEIKLAGGNIVKGIGNYHSKTPRIHRRYVRRVMANWRRLYKKYGKSGQAILADNR